MIQRTDPTISEEGSEVVVTLTYSYEVNGYHSGQIKRSFRSKADADQFVDRVKGRSVEVRYHPEHPKRPLLIEESLTAAERAGMLEEAKN